MLPPFGIQSSRVEQFGTAQSTIIEYESKRRERCFTRHHRQTHTSTHLGREEWKALRNSPNKRNTKVQACAFLLWCIGAQLPRFIPRVPLLIWSEICGVCRRQQQENENARNRFPWRANYGSACGLKVCTVRRLRDERANATSAVVWCGLRWV